MSDPFALRPDAHECLSRLELDRLLAGGSEVDEALRQRLTRCDHCQERLAALEAARGAEQTDARVHQRVDAILAAAERPARAESRRPARAPWRFWLPAATAAAAAAALLLFLLQRGEEPGQRGTIRLKGQPSLQVIVVDGERGHLLEPGETLAAGTTLSFRVSCPEGCFAALVGLGVSGPAYTIEAEVPPPWRVEAGPMRDLPVSADLDDEPGGDRLFAVFCNAAPDLSAARGAIEMAYASDSAVAQRPLARAPRVSLPGCVVRSQFVGRRP